jgi:ankyrin repeat protein
MNTDECEKVSFLIDDNNLEELKQVIKKDKNILNCRDRMDRTLLMYANEDRLYEIAKCLIESGADVNAKDENNKTPLHLASQNKAFLIIKLLIENDAQVNTQDNNGNTALLKVVYNTEIKEYLLEHGADMKLKNFHDVSPEDKLNY